MIYEVRKKIETQAIKVESEEDWKTVLFWLRGNGYDETDEVLRESIAPLVEAGTWFLRDEGSTVVYLSPDHNFWEVFTLLKEAEHPEPPVDHIADEFKF